MASILNLIRPEAAFDPDTIAPLRPSMRPATGSSGGEASAPSPPMRALCARWWRGGLSIERGIRDQKELADGAVRFLAANYRHERNSGKVLREQVSRRPRFPRLLLQTAEKACRRRNIAWSTGSVVPQRGFRPPYMALG